MIITSSEITCELPYLSALEGNINDAELDGQSHDPSGNRPRGNHSTPGTLVGDFSSTHRADQIDDTIRDVDIS